MNNRKPPRDHRGPPGSTALRWLLTLTLLGVAMLLAVLFRTRSSLSPLEGSSDRDLNPWEMMGCYELEVEPWDVEALAPSERDETSPAVRSLLATRFPSAIMLRSDSLDEWGRPLGTYRVVALAPKMDSAGDTAVERDVVDPVSALGPLRWFTSADTLWILGSLPGARAGIALFDRGDSLTGRARLMARAGSLTATVPAVARSINCSTREPEAPARRPRR